MRVRIRCQATFALNAPAIRSVGVATWPRLLLGEDWASGEPKVCPLLEGVLGRDMNPPGSAALARGWARARRSPSSGVEVESELWGQARQSFLWRPRLDLAAVSLTLSSGTAVGAGQATLFSCQVGQWSGEVTAVTSALSTEERASG